MTRQGTDFIDEQPGDRELRRLIEWEVSDVPGAPTRDEMISRVQRGLNLDRRGAAALYKTPAGRLILALALLGALLAGTITVGSWLSNRNAIVVAPTTEPTPSPTQSPSLPPAAPVGSLPPGTYTVRSDTLTPYSVTVPAGWTFKDGFISKGGDFRGGTGVAFTTWVITHVFVDACLEPRTMREVGTKESLTAALAAQGGHDTTGPTEVIFGGVPATRLEFAVPAGFDMDRCGGLVRLWPGQGGDDNSGEPMFAGQTTTIYVVEQEGRVTVAIAIRHVDSSTQELAELVTLAESVRFWQ
jgi:hypothetical protein